MRVTARISLVVLVLALLFLATFAIPLRTWRTGESDVPPLELLPAGSGSTALARRVWIDTDAACGAGEHTDPDDCFAILALLRSPALEVVGVSTVFGNASQDRTHRIASQLVAAESAPSPPVVSVYEGSREPLREDRKGPLRPAHEALRQALRQGPLTIIALGPLTNVAAALSSEPALQDNVARVIAVMGRRPGHLFHPTEGQGAGAMLFGHGPVFRDFNFTSDREAARRVLAMRRPITFIPYEAARHIEITGAALERMETAGGAAAWVATRAQGWLTFWNEEVGRDGFYPFDLLAAAYVLNPGDFRCARVDAWIGRDPLMRWFSWSPALLISQQRDITDKAEVLTPALYCPTVNGPDVLDQVVLPG